MKTEREIREYRDSLRKLVTHSCRSSNCIHCLGNEVVHGCLSWVLGENEAVQHNIDEINEKAAKEIKA